MNKKSISAWGFVLPAFMFAGIGIGLIFGDVKIGLFIGMAVGFLLAGLISWKNQTD